MMFYEIGWNIVRNGGLNKKTKYYSLGKNVFSGLILFRNNIYNVNWTYASLFHVSSLYKTNFFLPPPPPPPPPFFSLLGVPSPPPPN